MSTTELTPNSLSFLALTNEYCKAIESVYEYEKEEFVAQMLKLLPRIYITASDISKETTFEDSYIESYLEETTYDSVRNAMAQLIGEDDVYLEVFEEDMKFSDVPISASISENLADLYQEFYNLINSVQDAPTHIILSMLVSCKENFATYWGQTLCNVLRALNSTYYNN